METFSLPDWDSAQYQLPLIRSCSVPNGNVLAVVAAVVAAVDKAHARSMSQKSCVQKSCAKVKRKILVAPIRFWWYAAIEHAHIFWPISCGMHRRMRFRLMAYLFRVWMFDSFDTKRYKLQELLVEIKNRVLWVSIAKPIKHSTRRYNGITVDVFHFLPLSTTAFFPLRKEMCKSTLLNWVSVF